MFECIEEWARELVEKFGYLGIFLVSYTESIIQPVPPDPFIAGGTAFGLKPLLASLVATLASVLGGLTAHGLGQVLGPEFVRRLVGERNFLKGEALFERYGIWAVLIAGFTPIPFKVVCWLAGIFRMRRTPFVVASFFGRFPRFLLVAYTGDFISHL